MRQPDEGVALTWNGIHTKNKATPATLSTAPRIWRKVTFSWKISFEGNKMMMGVSAIKVDATPA